MEHWFCNLVFWLQSLNRWLIHIFGTSLIVQCLRIHLPRQGTWVRSLVQEDFICWGATKSPYTTTIEPYSRVYWLQLPNPCAKTTELMCRNYWRPCALEPVPWNRSHRNENSTVGCISATKAWAEEPRPSTTKNKYIVLKKYTTFGKITSRGLHLGIKERKFGGGGIYKL